MADNRRRFPLVPLVVMVLLPLAYVLSYAPVYRLGKQVGWSRARLQPAVYRPVTWLIDNTPLDEPLYRWAGVWGVRGDFVWDAAFRGFHRGVNTSILLPNLEAETPHLFEHTGTGSDNESADPESP